MAKIVSPQRRTLTKRLIREAMLELLKKESIQNISVSELCQCAGINRTTFYNHYNGTFEVLAEIEENFLAELSGGDDSSAQSGNLTQHIESLCIRLQQNAEVAILLLNNNVDPQFSQKLLSGQGLGGVWQQLGSGYTAEERELLTDFLRGGAYAMVCRWLVGGCRQTPKQIATLLAKTIQNGVTISR